MTSSVLLGFRTTTRAVQIRDLIQPLSYIFLLIVWVWGMPELPHVISAYAVSHAVAFAMGIAFLAQHIPHLGGALAGVRSQIAPLVRYSLPLVFVGFIQYLLTWIDIFLLGYFRPAVDVGLYQAASQVALGLTLFLVAVNSIYAPMAAEAHRQDDLPRLSALFRSTTRWVCCLSVPAFVVLIVQAPAVLAVFGGEYADRGWPVLVLVACGQLVNCVTGGVGYTLIMTGRQKVELANVTLLLALNVGAGILLIPSLGAVGAAIAAAGTATLVNLVRVAQVYRWYRILPEIRGTWLLLLLAAGAVILASVEGRGAPSGAWALEKIVLILVTMAIGLKNFLHPAERRLVARHVDGLLRGVRR
jgi:O-antigen/teichoic acid export membrane protein